MPHLDVGAAKRFIKSGLWQPKTSEERNVEPNSKHVRFDGDDDVGDDDDGDDESKGNSSES